MLRSRPDQEPLRGRQPAGQRRGGEEHQPEAEDPASPEQVTEATAEQQEPAKGQRVRTDHPLQVVGAEPQVDLQLEVRNKWAALQALPPKRFPHLIDSATALIDCAASEQWLGFGMDTLMAGICGQARRTAS